MRKSVMIFLAILIVFLLLQWVSGTFHAPADGFTEIGFPFKFYSTTEGKLKPGFARTVVSYKFLFLNLLIFFLTVFIAHFIIKRKK